MNINEFFTISRASRENETPLSKFLDPLLIEAAHSLLLDCSCLYLAAAHMLELPMCCSCSCIAAAHVLQLLTHDKHKLFGLWSVCNTCLI